MPTFSACNSGLSLCVTPFGGDGPLPHSPKTVPTRMPRTITACRWLPVPLEPVTGPTIFPLCKQFPAQNIAPRTNRFYP